MLPFGSAPTSGGKTLVAELLLLRALLKHNGTMALLVVPYVALALEKRDYLRDVWSPLQVRSLTYLNGREGQGSQGAGKQVQAHILLCLSFLGASDARHARRERWDS